MLILYTYVCIYIYICIPKAILCLWGPPSPRLSALNLSLQTSHFQPHSRTVLGADQREILYPGPSSTSSSWIKASYHIPDHGVKRTFELRCLGSSVSDPSEPPFPKPFPKHISFVHVDALSRYHLHAQRWGEGKFTSPQTSKQ